MLGSIIGDIVGSIYDKPRTNIKTKDFPLFAPQCKFTDDTILTCATAEWLLNGGDVVVYYVCYAKKRPFSGYGSSFFQWLLEGHRTGKYVPYGSYGNGSAMRVAPIGWAFDTAEEVLRMAKISAECTHNHPEGIKGAQAVALSVFLARKGIPKTRIRAIIEQTFSYAFPWTVDELRPRYSHKGVDGKGYGGSCQDSVPQAILCALEAIDFEDAIRNSISLGGDSDTIACMAGGIAEALYGIPPTIRQTALSYLPEDYKILLATFEQEFGVG